MSAESMKDEHENYIPVENENFQDLQSKVYDALKEKWQMKIFEMAKEEKPDCVMGAEGQKIPCHKFMLTAHSKYLKDDVFSMLPPDEITSICIPDTKYDDLLAFKDFLYDGHADISSEQVQGIKKIARTFNVDIPEVIPVSQLDLDISSEKQQFTISPSKLTGIFGTSESQLNGSMLASLKEANTSVKTTKKEKKDDYDVCDDDDEDKKMMARP